jgi:hypothetical protein
VLRMVDMKITLLGSTITDLPNTSIVLLLENLSKEPFLNCVVIGSFCNPKQKFASDFALELDDTDTELVLVATNEPSQQTKLKRKG